MPCFYRECEASTLAGAYNNRGQIKYLRVDFDEAVEDFTSAIRTDSQFEIPLYNRGLIRYRLGFFDDAKKDFQQALELNPDFEDAKVSLQQTLLDQQHKIERDLRSGLHSDCVGNLMRLSLDKALAVGNGLECGYSMESDPWGNTRIYSSLLGCYVDNKVSHHIATPEAKGQAQDVKRIDTSPYDSGAAHGIWKLTFYTPEPVSMVLREAEQAGYGAMLTSTRLVMRSPYNTAETYLEDVDGVSMEVFRVSAYYKAPHGGVLFLNNIISWHVPRRMTPLVDGRFEILEKHMGINGKRLDRSQIASRGYTLSTTEFHISDHLMDTTSSKPRLYEPTAEIGSGQLMVQMRLAQDSSYELFYRSEDYPVVQYLRQPLYFEVELVESTDPNLELILENCWATLDEDRTSLPSWDIIVDSCENPDDSYVTIFHPVIFVHCDAEMCDAHSQADESCRGQCVKPAYQMNYRRERKRGSGLHSDCAGNLMRLSLDKALAVGNELECGYSMESDPWGNTRIYSSLLGCYVDNKSHAPDYQYHITYVVEPMLEVLWRTTETQDDTRYKVLFPITTPLMVQPPHVQENTVPEARVFSILLGPFLHDVVLRNITFFTTVLTVEESNASGFTVQEHLYSNGTKSISLLVPFDADIVLKNNQFYISVKYGSQGNNLKAMVGDQQLTPEMADYQFQENGTHFSLVLPYTAKDTTFELITSESLRASVYFFLLHTSKDWVLADLFLTCNFPLTTTKCYPNGTMTATAVKVDSVTDIIPNRLTLKDHSCKPTFSDDRFAYFSFSVASCGTTRTFFDHYMLYENEIALPYNKRASPNPEPLVTTYFLSLNFGFIILPEEAPFAHPVELQASLQDVELPTITGTCDQKQFYISVKYGSQGNNFKAMIGHQQLTPEMVDYQQTISCYYVVNETQTVGFSSKPRLYEPTAEIGSGQLMVQMRLAQDTVPEARVFSVLLGPLLHDVVLRNITFFTTVLTVEESNASGFTVQEHLYSNGTKSISVLVPFDADIVLKDNPEPLVTTYFLSLIFGFIILPEETPFGHLVELEVSLQDVECYPNGTMTATAVKVDSVTDIIPNSSYELFYRSEDYPVVKYLRQPLYFEVELVESTDPNLELILENCWATLDEDRTSLPSWDIIVDSCENPDDSYVTIFHPVASDARVLVPSHIKRFSMKMFTFTKDEAVLKDEIFVHCDVEICNAHSQADGSCRGQCVQPAYQMNYRRERKRLPTITGTCDHNQFYINVKFGSQGNNLKAMVGHELLTPEMTGYQFQEDGTHFSLVLPYTAKDTTFEVCRATPSHH
ncbi:Tetratricopeptide repeat protein 32 [Liparis tanakae]|uniref:Tetratricopeptide repeat protein 32 n=1 Tax=Liparis tanakae TaxID=230148 RepID=A0A4Z2FVB3_9TELE|nr:Tetratricopeptide repeat protein 32 [Liparis tanakae]